MAGEKVTGFQSITPNRHVGWNDKLISEFERIIRNFYKLPFVQALTKFHDDLYRHIHFSPDGHQIDISPWIDELLGNLYVIYRDWGYPGTRKDMLKAIYKELPIGTPTDIKEAYRSDLAITAQGWQEYFDKHKQSLTVHQNLHLELQPCDPPDTQPSLYFSNQFPQYVPNDPIPFETWKDTEGAIVYDFHYDLLQGQEQSGRIFSLTSDSFELYASYFYDGIKTLHLKHTLYTKEDEIILREVEVPWGSKAHVDVALTYRYNEIIVRDLFGTDKYNATLGVDPVTLTLNQPVNQFGTGLKEWMYYPSYMSGRQLLFFVN